MDNFFDIELEHDDGLVGRLRFRISTRWGEGTQKQLFWFCLKKHYSLHYKIYMWWLFILPHFEVLQNSFIHWNTHKKLVQLINIKYMYILSVFESQSVKAKTNNPKCGEHWKCNSWYECKIITDVMFLRIFFTYA